VYADLALDRVGWYIAYAMQVLITEIARKRSKAEKMVGEVMCGDEKKERNYYIRQNMFELVNAIFFIMEMALSLEVGGVKTRTAAVTSIAVVSDLMLKRFQTLEFFKKNSYNALCSFSIP